MEWGALVMWIALGVLAGIILCVAALVEFVSQFTSAKTDPEDATRG